MHSNLLMVISYTIIFATGATGLIYQVVWQKYLSRLLGSDSIATAIILATFLGGLSIGYFLCGKITTRVQNHFRGYALLEGIIGVWCLLFPSLFNAVESLTRGWSFSAPFLIIAQGLFSSALLMAIPTICMGGTIPFLTRGLSRNIREATKVHSMVYSINTAGAFIGTLIAGFYLIPIHGLPLTVMGASLINILGFFVFSILSKIPVQHPEAGAAKEDPALRVAPVDPRSSPGPSPGASVYPPTILYTMAFLSGFYVMTLENVMIRITNISMGSSSYSFSMIVSAFILSIAAGSYMVGRMKHVPRGALFINQLLITILLLGVYYSLDTLPYWSHLVRISFQPNIAGFWMYYLFVCMALTLLLLLPTGFMGAAIPIAFHEIKRNLENVGRHSGFLFSLNTLGNLAGSLLGGIVFYYFMNIQNIFLAMILLAAFSTALAGWCLSKKHFIIGVSLSLCVITLNIIVPFYQTNNFMLGTFRIRGPKPFSWDGPKQFYKFHHQNIKPLFYKDGPTASVAVNEFPDNPLFKEKRRGIFVNGKNDSSTVGGDMYTMRLAAHIPALLAKQRKKAFVIGLGTGVTAGELTLYPDIEQIDIAEISGYVVKAAPYFKDSNHDVANNPRVRFHIGDAFRIMGRSREKWDIVISEPSNPWVTGVDALFTSDFYHMVKEHLTDDGILVQWVQCYDSNIEMMGMVVNTLRREFPRSRAFMSIGADLLIVASNKPITRDTLEAAEEVFNANKRVKASLADLNIELFDSILLREIWSPSYIADRFSDYGLQTLDNPVLHYIAGKAFFFGRVLPSAYFLSKHTVLYSDEYLFSMKNETWREFTFTRETVESHITSLRDIFTRTSLPMAESLLLKCYLSDPERVVFSPERKKRLAIDYVHFIMTPTLEESRWSELGHENASVREKASILQTRMEKRNWLANYPIDGLKALLQNGISTGGNDQEKNWCTLTMARILLEEKEDLARVKAVLSRVTRRVDGKVDIKGEDVNLLISVEKLFKSAIRSSKSDAG